MWLCKPASLGGGGGYREMQGVDGSLVSTGIVFAASLLGRSRGGARFLKRKANKRREEVCGREEIGYFKTHLR